MFPTHGEAFVAEFKAIVMEVGAGDRREATPWAGACTRVNALGYQDEHFRAWRPVGLA